VSDLTWTNETRRLGDLIPWPRNPRKIGDAEAERLKQSREQFEQPQVVVIGPGNEVYDGHQRLKAWGDKWGPDLEIAVRVSSRLLTEQERKQLTVLLHRGTMGDWDFEALKSWDTGDLLEWGFDQVELEAVGFEFGEEKPPGNHAQARTTLAERFVVPPFSVLDARQGYWQERKRAWIALGIRSEIGRYVTGPNITSGKNTAMLDGEGPATSIFDPALCEIAYTWFCPPSGAILDPFAGGSVRGIVAAYLGRKYTGVELRSEQVQANIGQAKALELKPNWIVGDAANVKKLVAGEYDFIFSCPPYYDLEVYSDLDGELSALPTYEDFIAQYRAIVADCVSMLKDDRFACFVVGDIRDKHGHYRNFVSDTIAAFQDAGAALYNEAILVTAVGSLPIRVGRQFEAGRKLGKTHQNVLAFVKGDWRKATEACGPVEVGTLETAEN